MKTIKLYGELGRRFGKTFTLDVKTPAEAVRALCAIVSGFRNYILQNNEPGYKVYVGKEQYDKEEIHYPTSSKDVIKIIPYIVGSGGFFKVILGIALIIIAPYAGAFASALFNAGISMILSGISEALFAPPKPEKQHRNEKPENKPSYSFAGPVNTVTQGNPVPVCYGELRVGSQIISAGLYAQETAI